MWRNVENEDSKTCIYMKIEIYVPDCTIDQMQKCFSIEVRRSWEDNAEFKKLTDQDIPDGDVVYVAGPKPKLPMIDQRDFISMFYHRNAFFLNADGTTAAHASVRVSGGLQETIMPPSKGMTRGEEYLIGQFVMPAPQINGVRLLGIVHRDMKGKLPEVVLQKAAEKAPMKFYESVMKIVKAQ